MNFLAYIALYYFWQLPSLCEDHSVNLTIRIEDNLQNHFSKGPIEYRGSIQVMELVRVRLEKEQTYWIQVEAEIAEQRILSNKWLIGMKRVHMYAW